jgi:hypothetical protein
MGFRNWLGGHKRKIIHPGFFGKDQVGGMWGDYLKELYSTPTGESSIFRGQSMALRDALSMESDTQKEEFAAASSSGGFYDSGARLSGLGEIDRNRIASYSQGLSGILAKLESDKMGAAFPFLQAQISEWSAFQSAMNFQDELQTQRKKQIAQTTSSVFGSASGGGGQGSMGNTSDSSGGNYGGCWVAEAIFGKDSPLTHLARFYVNNLAPAAFKAWYLENGQDLASMVRKDPTLRHELTPLFLSFAGEAASG